MRPYALDLALSLIALEDSLGKKDGPGDEVRASSELSIVEAVTAEHGARFAAEWYDRSRASGAMTEVFEETGVISWPEDSRHAQGRFHETG